MDRQLKKIATASRKEMESFARKHNYIGSGDDLSCYCGIASYFLVMMGRKFGYNLTLVEGVAFEYVDDEETIEDLRDQTNHCWVEYKGMIIDLTATQFALVKKVHIVGAADEKYWPTDRNNTVRKNLKADWPDDQSPYSYLKELRKRANKLSIKIAA